MLWKGGHSANFVVYGDTCESVMAAGYQAAVEYCAAHSVECTFQPEHQHSTSCSQAQTATISPAVRFGNAHLVNGGGPNPYAEAHCVENNSTRQADPSGTGITCNAPDTAASIFKGTTQPRICIGNPIDPGFANKTQVETDYVGSGPFPLLFRRQYHSGGYIKGYGVRGGSQLRSGAPGIGRNWWHSYYGRVMRPGPASTVAFVQRPNGASLTFTLSSSVWTPDADVVDKLETTSTGWKFTTADGDVVETYDSDGRLLTATNRQGLVQTYSYLTSGPHAGFLEKVTDPFGRELTFRPLLNSEWVDCEPIS